MSSSQRGARLGKSWPSSIERLSERVNPILVKEVRQALRGQYFRLTFWITLSAATVIGLIVLTMVGSDDEPMGPVFFQTIFACLAVAAHGFVPFSAFVAMGSEWEENTLDLLVLSNLRPRDIVLGKLLSAGTQALLLYSAFGPFLVFAFLLGGVDLFAILVTLAGSMLLSLGLSASAIALSTSAQAKFMRVVAMAALAAFLVWVTGVSMVFAGGLMQSPGVLRDKDVLLGIAAFASVLLVFVPVPLAQACARLAHPEENRSTALRVLAYFMPAFALGWATYFLANSPDEEVSVAYAMGALLFLAFTGLVFLSEPLRMGQRARLGIPRSPILALLTLPLQPGGARALLWYLAGGLGVWAWFLAVNALWPESSDGLSGWRALVPGVAILFGLVYLGLPGLLAREREDLPRTRITIRLLAPALAAFLVLAPAIYGFFAGDAWLSDFQHGGNPVWVLYLLWEGKPSEAVYGMVAVSVVALAVLALHAPRFVRAARETLAASASRRALRSVRARAPEVPELSASRGA